MGIATYYCPDSLDFNLQGNTFSNVFQTFSLLVYKCDSSTSVCQSDADIATFVDTLIVDAPVVNTYFDFDDYNKPIKSYIDDRFLTPLMSDVGKIVYTYVQ